MNHCYHYRYNADHCCVSYIHVMYIVMYIVLFSLVNTFPILLQPRHKHSDHHTLICIALSTHIQQRLNLFALPKLPAYFKPQPVKQKSRSIRQNVSRPKHIINHDLTNTDIRDALYCHYFYKHTIPRELEPNLRTKHGYVSTGFATFFSLHFFFLKPRALEIRLYIHWRNQRVTNVTSNRTRQE